MSDIIQSTTQQFLDIYDITNNFVIMKDGTVSTILTVDAMNFGLLAEEEQDAIMYAYAGLLNSLNYPVQIIIHSQTKDVTSYLKILQEQELQAENETMRRRIRMYREFVGNLIHERNVLDKKFYVVIPATALEMGFLATSGLLPGSKPFDISTVERSLIIEKAKNLLDPKRDHLIAQFARIGLFSRQLATQEIIQLFYIRYNPEAIEGQQIGESSSYTTPLVKASIQENLMNSSLAAPSPIQPTTPSAEYIPTQEATLQPQTIPQVPDAQSELPPQPQPIAPMPDSATQVMQPHLQPIPEIHVATTPIMPDPVITDPAPTPVASLEPVIDSEQLVPPAPPPTLEITPVPPTATTEQIQPAIGVPPTPVAQQTTTEIFSAPEPQISTTPPSTTVSEDLPPLPEI